LGISVSPCSLENCVGRVNESLLSCSPVDAIFKYYYFYMNSIIILKPKLECKIQPTPNDFSQITCKAASFNSEFFLNNKPFD